MLSADNKTRIISALSIFETGKPNGDYGNVTVLKDATDEKGNNFFQITYGYHQTTEQSHLKALLEAYVAAKGIFAAAILPYLSRIGKGELVKNEPFLELLRKSGKEDPIMCEVQDTFFDKVYFQPALLFFQNEGFTLPLSMLVIYDSYIHSGSIKEYLRKRFNEKTPKNGGNERAWIKAYTIIRHAWLTNHKNEILRRTNYRTRCFLELIERGDWLLVLPIEAQGETSKFM
jgi:chitosanase